MICQVQRWKDLDCWIPVTLALPQLRSGDYVPLSELLSVTRAPIDLKRKPISTLSVIRKISFGGTIEVRTEKEKESYKGNLFLAEAGYLIISKINFIHGSFCVIPNDVGPVAVSSEYPTFAIDRQRILPDYLNLVLRTDAFRNQLTRIRSGSAKKRVQATSVLDKTIPLPSPVAQRQMVTAYQKSLGKAAELEAKALQIEHDAQREFEAALGLTPPPNLPKRPFQIAHFKDIERWSHEGILQTALLGDAPPESKFEIIQLGDIATVSYGLQKCPANRPGKHPRPYLRVANVQRGYLDLHEIKLIDVSEADMPKYRLEDSDILLCEGNSADLVGRGSIWKNEIVDCVHQNHVLRVRLDRRRAIPEFILAYINSPSGQAYFRSKAKRTTNLASINSKEVANLPVPLPDDTATQALILLDLTKGQQAAAAKRKQAATLRAAAWNDFIAAVFA
jgi:type I restriction enzyme S subunit